MRADLDEARLGLIWKHEILPYLEDHFFDAPERLREFDLERLKRDGAMLGEDTSAARQAT